MVWRLFRTAWQCTRWPDQPAAASQLPLEPNKHRRTRSTEPTPFTGLIHPPRCEACQQGPDPRPKAALGSPPPIMPFSRGRRRTVDTHAHCCPEPDGAYHGWLGRGHLRAKGPPGGQPWCQLQCVACHGYCSETPGTIFPGKRSSPELSVRVIAGLAEGWGMRGTAGWTDRVWTRREVWRVRVPPGPQPQPV